MIMIRTRLLLHPYKNIPYHICSNCKIYCTLYYVSNCVLTIKEIINPENIKIFIENTKTNLKSIVINKNLLLNCIAHFLIVKVMISMFYKIILLDLTWYDILSIIYYFASALKISGSFTRVTQAFHQAVFEDALCLHVTWFPKSIELM